MSKKTYKERIFQSRPSKTDIVPKDFADCKAGQTIIIPSFTDIYDYIQHIPAGERRSVKDLRQFLAQKYGADVACPIVCGMGVRICAEYGYEQYSQGDSLETIVPFWRIIDEKSPTAKKITFDKAILSHLHQLAG